MKKLLFFSLLLTGMFVAVDANSQSILDRAKQKVKDRADRKVDESMEKGLDEVEGKSKTKTKTKDGETKIKTDEDGEVKIKTESKNDNGQGDAKKEEPFTYTSKYDFVPGAKVIAFEDFNTTEIGDFPARWNTNASAEVVTINQREGKWLKVNKVGVWHPEFITTLPENFTLEFDVAVNTGWIDYPSFVVNIGALNDPKKYTNMFHYVNWNHGAVVHLELHPSVRRSEHSKAQGYSRIQAGKDGNHDVNNEVTFSTWDNESKNIAHVAIWRQNQRMRVYVNGQKIWDLPRTFDAASKYNTVTFAAQAHNSEDNNYMFSNIRLAVGAPDTRNKLITEGKFVTNGILFDVNSDQIKPESYGALRDIANVLKENAAVKVKIIGHTDSDGDDAKNMDLSKRRAAAVKAFLVKEFSINGDNLSTDGKGETAPVDKNATAEGKANNRRVEFVKL